jgi:hypothetical protein
MTMQERIIKMRGFISAIAGLFAGAFAAQLIPWPMLPKALVVMAVTSVIIGILLLALSKPQR